MSDGKVKGVVDIVVLLDTTGSMQECLDAVKGSVEAFITTLTSKDANNESPIKDWRIKVVGFRDQMASGSDWYVDNPFVQDLAAVQAQLGATNLQASGGGDEPESLLDALFKIATMEQAGVQDAVDPNKWRRRGTCARAIIFFTDASFKIPMTILEATGGGIDDVIAKITDSRIILCGFCPDWDGYDSLGSVEGAKLTKIVKKADSPVLIHLGEKTEEGRAAQLAAVEAMKTVASNNTAFEQIMRQLAKTVAKSSVVEVSEC